MVERFTATRVDAPRSRLGEGPLWDESTQTLWWTDILGKTVRSMTWDSGEVESIEVPAAVGALFLTESGAVLAAAPDGIRTLTTWDLVCPIEEENEATRCNDGKADPFGHIVQGTMDWNQEPGAGAVYRVDGDATEVLLTGVTVANGLAWSSDRSTFYHIDSPTREVRSFAYAESGPLGAPERLVAVTADQGFPDGMTTDTDDHLWVALWEGGAVHRYSPGGDLVAVIDVPAQRVTSCCFGGPHLDTLFITTAEDDEGSGGELHVAVTGRRGRPPDRVLDR